MQLLLRRDDGLAHLQGQIPRHDRLIFNNSIISWHQIQYNPILTDNNINTKARLLRYAEWHNKIYLLDPGTISKDVTRKTH